ncbi:unnamed protein product [Rotaria magnacalcarata]|uniref:Hexosyltransferase n=1 Tax=Rotaria magnacalcarata TaxID=392030 RepID=A0A816ZML2_9BILA|nr:unnamed protein product [Rotaria magnacalcarata]CAF2221811.1 unnamed protein product [Rotaria magnacalcarata]CAF3820458.1 unnamed protein product [Rotaria magnacalcarata]CAF4072444.1 unnamed protein product [Rotaria magnacalcarata]
MRRVPKNYILQKSCLILICFTICIIYLTLPEKTPTPNLEETPVRTVRGVIVTLIRSANRSIFLTINMIHSITQFYPNNGTFLYPLIIFHEEDLTSVMRQQILSCVLKSNGTINISFALVNFNTSISPNTGSRPEKPIGYRLMCRFWTYDVFYHPAIIQGKYEYLMRMDDDSYFSDRIKKDPFLYMDSRRLDYMYRSTYKESAYPLYSILKPILKRKYVHITCIYNNFFMIRLKWYYESPRVQNFVNELIKDNLILREYIGDGCIHGAMLHVDRRHVRVEHVRNIPYGHNYHVMPTGYQQWKFQEVNDFHEVIHKSCEQLTVLKGIQGKVTHIKMS